MSADLSKLHKIARGALGLLAGGSFVGMTAGGYVDGAETNVGIDAGVIRDAITAGITLVSVWYPKFTRFGVFWRSLTNHETVETAQNDLSALKERIELLEASEVDPTPTARRKRSRK